MHGWLSREVKTLYKTLGTSPLTFEQLETVVIDIKKHLNNLPLTHVKSREGELETLMQYVIMWGGKMRASLQTLRSRKKRSQGQTDD